MSASRLPGRPADRQADDLAIGAVVYQCETLKEQIRPFTKPPHSVETQRIAWVFYAATRALETALRQRLAVQDKRPLGVNERKETHTLTRAVQRIAPLLRYLYASEPGTRADCLQKAITQIAQTYVQPDNHAPKDLIVLVRAQWSNTPTFQDLFDIFEEDEDLIGAFSTWGKTRQFRPIVERFWTAEELWKGEPERPPGAPPASITLVAFARLDAGDTLLFPLLAHEVAHNVDYAFNPFLSASPDALDAKALSTDAKHLCTKFPKEVATGAFGDAADGVERWLLNRAATALQELAADQIALRIMGVAYFIAFAEFFKPQKPWPGDQLEIEAYPGFGYRMMRLFEGLRSGIGNFHHLDDLRELAARTGDPAVIHALEYVDAWERQIDQIEYVKRERDSFGSTHMAQLETRVDRAASRLLTVIADRITPSAELGQTDEIIDVLRLIREYMPQCRRRRPKGCETIGRAAIASLGYNPRFQNVLIAGWMYQLHEGERHEERTMASRQHHEYRRFCALLRGLLTTCSH